MAERPMTFVELMRIKELRGEYSDGDVNGDTVDEICGGEREGGMGRERRFMSLNPSYEPGGGSAYGGHVFAQAVWTASVTVGEEGMVAHNVHGFFTLPGLPDRPYIYHVSILSSDRSYATRYVTVKQPLVPSPNRPFQPEDCDGELSKVCFACLVSFKVDERVGDEERGTGHQMKESVRERLRDVFEGLRPETLERCPDVDAPWYRRHIAAHPQPPTFPGLEMRKLTLPSTDPSSWTNLTFYRTIGVIPPTDYNLHACAHMYASDRNSIEIVSNALGFGDEVGSIGSLSHSMVFHVEREGLVMREGEWWVQEAGMVRSGQGRGMHESWIWRLVGGEVDGKGEGEREGRKDVHIASQWQEGMLRRVNEKGKQRQRVLWEEGMRGRGVVFPGDVGERKSGRGKCKL